jgi:hypothetical protein
MDTPLDDAHQVEHFDHGGWLSIEEDPAGGDSSQTFRLAMPQFRVNGLRTWIARDVPWLHDYGDLTLFPSFRMDPERFELLVVSALAARINALYRTRPWKHAATLRDLFPGCRMHPSTPWLVLLLAANTMRCEEERQAQELRDVEDGRKEYFLRDDVWIHRQQRSLVNATGYVLKCFRNMKCIDARVVMEQEDSERKAHIAIQCKSGAKEVLKVGELYEEAMAYMGTVPALDHFYVLAPLYAACVKLPEGWGDDDNLPEGLILVTSMRDFAPLLGNYVDFMCSA